ncbi:baseplate protein [Roseobacter cerasinus]|uniref:Baseplate protein n=1 Tax=Roseobacter cerasinus TaxID=2602289 RepID=A0A640VTD8_9RHOB|nr:GPW/gp25 family protein [Roseobacter cerasinus]GFE50690.1 baseplate protein [Roseobacter cerasinus]
MAEHDPSFLGRGWAFPPDFDNGTGQAQLVQAEEDIAESLRILMETRPGERVMHPNYGCRLHDLVFEPMDGETEAEIETAIRRAILFFEPRIKITSILVDVRNALDGHLAITLTYTVIETNERHNMVFPFYITEGTLISDKPVPAA